MTFSPSANRSLPARDGDAILPRAIYNPVLSETGVNSHYAPEDKSHLSGPAEARVPDIPFQTQAASLPPPPVSARRSSEPPPPGFATAEETADRQRRGAQGTECPVLLKAIWCHGRGTKPPHLWAPLPGNGSVPKHVPHGPGAWLSASRRASLPVSEGDRTRTPHTRARAGQGVGRSHRPVCHSEGL